MIVQPHTSTRHTDLLFLYELLVEISALENQQYAQYISLSFVNHESDDIQEYITTTHTILKALDSIAAIQPSKRQSFAFWQMLNSLQSRPFLTVVETSKNKNINLRALWTLALNQLEREQTVLHFRPPVQQLDYYTESYAKLVALIFKNGAKLANRGIFVMYNLGYYFGKLTYLLKIYHQYIIDKESNILDIVFNTPAHQVTENQHQILEQYLQKVKAKILHQIRQLRISQEKLRYFSNYLDHHLQYYKRLASEAT